jgi:hypothetical protein
MSFASRCLFVTVLCAVLPPAAASAATLEREDPGRVPLAGLQLGGGVASSDERLGDWQDISQTFREIRFHLAHPNLREGFTYAGFALGAFYLQLHKYDLHGEIQQDRTNRGDVVSSRVRPLGEAIIPLAALTTYAIGRFSGSEQTRRVGLILSESAAFTVLATEIGQFVLSEQRPADGGKLRFFSYGGHGVSGHTSIVASMSVPLDRLFFKIEPDDSGWMKAGKYIGKGVVYGLPILTGWSRVNDNKHYDWNVLLGLGTGYMMGSFVSSAHGLDGRDRRERNWNVVPISDDHGAPGLAMRWSMR